MKITLDAGALARHLLNNEYTNYTPAGADALAEFLYNLDADTGEDTELDVVAIRCEYREFPSLLDWALSYFGGQAKVDAEFGDDVAVDARNAAIREYIMGRGVLIEFKGGIIVSEF